MAAPQDIADRFWPKVAVGPVGACWPWQASIHPQGYGIFRRAAGPGQTAKSHRVAFELAVGKIPPGQCVCHRCDNRACCNPAHLFLGTTQENTADRVAKGRSSRGERQADAKLTDQIVREARAAFPRLHVRALALRYGVSHPTMWKAVHGKTWRHVA